MNHKSTYKWAAGFALSIAMSVATAAPLVIDQEHLTPFPYPAWENSGGLAAVSTQDIAQSFTAGQRGLLWQVDLVLARYPEATGTFELSILPGAPLDGGTPLFSRAYSVTEIPLGSERFSPSLVSFDVHNAAAIMMSPGEVYSIVLTHAGSYPNWVMWSYSGNGGLLPSDLYAGGDSYNTYQGNWRFTGTGIADQRFRTWVLPIPEPTSAALLLVGLVGITVSTRRRH